MKPSLHQWFFFLVHQMNFSRHRFDRINNYVTTLFSKLCFAISGFISVQISGKISSFIILEMQVKKKKLKLKQGWKTKWWKSEVLKVLCVCVHPNLVCQARIQPGKTFETMSTFLLIQLINYLKIASILHYLDLNFS